MANKYLDLAGLQDYTTKLNTKLKTIFATKGEVGAPLVASTVAEMTDEDRIYVYTGSETGYTSGNWYYWDGEAWTSGGTYNSQGIGDGEVTTEKIANGAVTEQKLSGELASVIRDLGDDLYNLYPNDIAEGEIASFPDGADDIPVKSMAVNVEPYQNLNGYDYPWVGGAGANILPFPYADGTGTVNNVTFTVNADGSIGISGTSSAVTYFNFAKKENPITLKAGTYYMSAPPTSLRFTLLNATDDTEIVNTTTGASFTLVSDTQIYGYIRIGSGVSTYVTAYPQIAVGSTAPASWTPYENICPIYPANGKNLYNKDIPLLDGYIYNGEIATDGKSKHSYMIPVVGGQNYTLSGRTGDIADNTIKRVHGYDSNGDWVQQLATVPSDGSVSISGNTNYSASFFVPSTVVGIMISFGNVANGTKPDIDVQLERGSFATSYVPYRAFGMTRTGLNQFDLKQFADEYPYFCTMSGDVLSISANSALYSTGCAVDIPCDVFGGGYLTADIKNGTATNTRIRIICEDGTSVETTLATSTSWTTCSCTLPSKRIVAVRLNWSSTGTFDIRNLCISPTGQSEQYEPYQPIERYYSRDYNMWDEEWANGYFNNGVLVEVPTNPALCSKNFIPVEEGKTYYIKQPTSSNTRIFKYDSTQTYISYADLSVNAPAFTVASGVSYIKFCQFDYGAGAYHNDVIINYSNPSQVGYGGVLDVDTGVLTVTHNIVNLGSLTWQKFSVTQGTLFRTTITSSVLVPENIKADAICSNYPVVARSSRAEYTVSAGGTVYDIIDSSYADADAFKTAMNGVMLVYELATPVQYQLTPTQVKTLLGYNNIWTDSGTVEVNYRADTTKYIQKLIGSTEDDMIANANIPAHQYFMVGMELFYSTSAIAQGSAIVVGTNCTRTTLAEALNAINS